MLSPRPLRHLHEDELYARQDDPTTTPPDTTTTNPTPTTTPPTTPTDPTTTPPPTTPTPPPTSTRTTSIAGVTSVITLPGGGVTTVITSVIVIDGQTSTMLVTPTTTPDSGGGHSNVGTIVGASIAGVIGLALIGLIWFILLRKSRERRHKAYENDIFNPDHTARGPNFDLGGGPGPETIPDPYTFDDRPAGAAGPAMQQYQPHDGYAPVPLAAGAYAASGPSHPLSPHHGQPYYDAMSVTSNGTTPGLAGVGVAGALGGAAVGAAYAHNRTSGTLSTDAVSTHSGDRSSTQPLTGRATKEREAFARSQARMSHGPIMAPGMLTPAHTGNASLYGPGAGPTAYNYGMGPAPTASSQSQYSSDSGNPTSPVRSSQGHAFNPTGFGVANPDGIPRAGTPGGPVVVHQDAGRVPVHANDNEDDDQEIPPTYDSIPVDDRSRGGPAPAAGLTPSPAATSASEEPSVPRPASAELPPHAS